MPSSLFRVVVKQPELLLDHAQAYAELFDAELTALGAVYGRRARLNAIMLCCLTIGATLAGVAVMLVSVLPHWREGASWTLGLVPMIPLGAAYLCHRALRTPEATPFEVLRHQMRADIQLLRGVGRP